MLHVTCDPPPVVLLGLLAAGHAVEVVMGSRVNLAPAATTPEAVSQSVNPPTNQCPSSAPPLLPARPLTAWWHVVVVQRSRVMCELVEALVSHGLLPPKKIRNESMVGPYVRPAAPPPLHAPQPAPSTSSLTHRQARQTRETRPGRPAAD